MLERRKRRRFPIQQPILLKIREEITEAEIRGLTQDVSEIGVLLVSAGDLPLGTKVGITLSMPNDVELFALGTVVRRQSSMEAKTAIAIHCTHSFTETPRATYQAAGV